MIDYDLPFLALAEVQCHKIFSTIIQTGLDYIGICHNFPQYFIHGPVSMQVLVLINLYNEQLGEYMEVILNHGHLDTVNEKPRHFSLQCMKVKLGIGTKPFTFQYYTYVQYFLGQCLTHTWYFSIFGYQVVDTFK